MFILVVFLCCFVKSEVIIEEEEDDHLFIREKYKSNNYNRDTFYVWTDTYSGTSSIYGTRDSLILLKDPLRGYTNPTYQLQKCTLSLFTWYRGFYGTSKNTLQIFAAKSFTASGTWNTLNYAQNIYNDIPPIEISVGYGTFCDGKYDTDCWYTVDIT